MPEAWLPRVHAPQSSPSADPSRGKGGGDYKLISKWQGHADGGKLILDTYTEVFGGKDADYEQPQLAKIG